jgi:hypothetical protein
MALKLGSVIEIGVWVWVFCVFWGLGVWGFGDFGLQGYRDGYGYACIVETGSHQG